MWAVVCLAVCACGLFFMYLYREETEHERQFREELDAKIKAKEEELKAARSQHPDDFDLHAALKRDLRRLREQRKEA